MWASYNEGKGHTVYYCPVCKCQMTWHTVSYNIWKCNKCGLEMIYKHYDQKLHLS